MAFCGTLTGYTYGCRCDLCKEVKSAYNSAWARTHRRYGRPNQPHDQKRIYARNREIVNIAKNRPCADCGVQYPFYIMQFDHLRDKRFTIAGGMLSGEQTLRDEIAKCDVVCANCHHARTYSRMKSGAAPAAFS